MKTVKPLTKVNCQAARLFFLLFFYYCLVTQVSLSLTRIRRQKEV